MDFRCRLNSEGKIKAELFTSDRNGMPMLGRRCSEFLFC